MVQIVGRYQYVSNENFDEFVKALGQQELAAPLLASKPIIEITQNGDQWTVVVTSDERSSTTTFKLNEPYEEKLPSFERKFPSIATKEGEKLRVETTVIDDMKIIRVYEFTETGMQVHVSATSVDVKAVRTYKRL
ncbi:FABP-like protein [Nomia melanderi]|uniref:FABP-like protein n=1 Tax=Nomia melanderi TaxID=2448451 RepID=UPI00130468AA|nr:fatty acid-binding protein homolog 7-like [Nomia melanderi]